MAPALLRTASGHGHGYGTRPSAGRSAPFSRGRPLTSRRGNGRGAWHVAAGCRSPRWSRCAGPRWAWRRRVLSGRLWPTVRVSLVRSPVSARTPRTSRWTGGPAPGVRSVPQSIRPRHLMCARAVIRAGRVGVEASWASARLAATRQTLAEQRQFRAYAGVGVIDDPVAPRRGQLPGTWAAARSWPAASRRVSTRLAAHSPPLPLRTVRALGGRAGPGRGWRVSAVNAQG